MNIIRHDLWDPIYENTLIIQRTEKWSAQIIQIIKDVVAYIFHQGEDLLYIEIKVYRRKFTFIRPNQTSEGTL